MDRKRRLMENNNGWPLRSQLIDGAPFRLPLTNTAVPASAASGTTGTFTRATTSTWPNNDGYLVTGLSGEIGFVGARRVRNLLTFTEDFSNAVWSATGLTKTATALTEQATGADHSVRYTVASGKNVFQIKVKPNGRTRCALASTGSTLKSAIFNLTTVSVEGALTDAFTTLGDTPTITLQSDGYYLLTMGNLSGSSTLVDFYMLDATSTVRSYAGDITKGMFVKQAQLEDVTAQTTQTAGEYVSVGVASDWAGTELVTNGTFDTDATGWTAVNSTLSIISGKLRVTNVGANAGYCHQAITTVIGQKYVLSATVTQQTSSTYSIYIGNGPGSGALGGLGTNASVEFTATATTTYLSPINTQAVDGRYTDFDNISVKPAYYHGSFVDGVKCFATDINGSPIPSTTLLGYQAQGARTNATTYSQDMSNAAWTANAINVSIVADQYAAPDGTTTADKILASAGNAAHYIYNAAAVPNGASTLSVFLRYVNHRWISLRIFSGAATNAHVSFDLLNGTVGAVGSGSATISATAIPGVYRATITGTTTSTSGNVLISLNNTNTASIETWNAAGTEAVGAWGWQTELGSFASNYTATTTIAVAENPDVESVSTSSNIAAAAGSVYLEFTPTHTPSGTIALWGTYVDASNYTAILHDATNLIFRKRITGVNYDATIANAFVSGTTYKACATWGTAGTSITLNGTEGTPHANTTAAQIAATMQWGADGNSLQQPFASIRNGRDWLRQLSASERAAVTA